MYIYVWVKSGKTRETDKNVVKRAPSDKAIVEQALSGTAGDAKEEDAKEKHRKSEERRESGELVGSSAVRAKYEGGAQEMPISSLVGKMISHRAPKV